MAHITLMEPTQDRTAKNKELNALLADLVKRWQAGDTKAFAKLHTEYNRLIGWHCNERNIDRHQGADIRQEFWLRIITRKGQFDERVGGYFWMVLRSVLNNHLRAVYRKPALLDWEIKAQSLDPFQQAVRSERHQFLHDAIDKMSKKLDKQHYQNQQA